jgi:signal transduction histidine kinase/CheY-like chemotaxis protein
VKLASRFYLLAITAAVIAAIWGILFDWLDLRHSYDQLLEDAMAGHRQDLAELATDPLFGYYVSDSRNGFPEEADLALRDIRVLLDTALIETARRPDARLARLAFFSPAWELLTGPSDAGRQAAASPGALESAILIDDLHRTAARIGVDSDGDGRLTGSEVGGYLAGEYVVPLGEFRKRVFTHWRGRALELVGEVALLVLLVLLGARTVARPLDAMASRARNMGRTRPVGEEARRPFAEPTNVEELESLRAALNQMMEEVEHQQAEFIAARDEAVRANRAKTRFLAAASHDLRQPIQAISLFVSVLARMDQDPRRREIIDKTQGSIRTLTELLTSLLDVSRLDAGAVSPSPRFVRASTMLSTVVDEFQPLAAERGLKLRYVPCDRVVYSDPVLLERILRNLLNNALRYTHEGRILIGCRRHGDRLRFEIHDCGIGIPESEQDLIFEEFHQVGEEARNRREGLGLGLAIVRRLSSLMGHGLDLRSEPGRGSVFSIEVAAHPGWVEDTAGEVVPAAVAALEGVGVLVIDDDPDILAGLRMELERAGCAVWTASSGRAAVQTLAVENGEPDVIVADYRLLGGETGTQAIAAVRSALGRHLPGILITGDTAPERISEALASGHELLHKPVATDTLRASIAHHVGRAAGSSRGSRAADAGAA